MSLKRVLLAVVVGFVVLTTAIGYFADDGGTSHKEIAFSDVVVAAQGGGIQRIDIRSRELTVFMRNETEPRSSYVGSNTDVVQVLEAAGVAVGKGDAPQVWYSKPAAYGNWIGIGIAFVPSLVVVIIFYYTLRNGTREGFRRALEMFAADRA